MKTQSGFAKVQGGRLYYESAGSGDAIVLIHGNVGDRRHWDGQFSSVDFHPDGTRSTIAIGIIVQQE